MKALLFVPYAGIWQHTSLEVSVANKLEKLGFQTTIVSCGEILKSPCLTMQSHGLTQIVPKETAQRVCRECSFHSKLIFANSSRNFLSLSNLLETSDFAQVEKLIKNLSKENWETWRYQGIAIGAYSSYEVLLNHKLIDADIPENLWTTYLNAVRNSLLSLIAMEKVLAGEKFDYLFFYNRNYSTNKSVSALAENLGMKTISLSATGPMSDMYGRLLMTYQDVQIATLNKSKSWELVKDIPLSKNELNDFSLHLNAILQAKSPWVYSAKYAGLTESEIRKKLRIVNNRKIILLALSSADEVFAANTINVLPIGYGTNLLFKSQIDWIQYILDVAELLPQYHFVVRVHPREFPNKRESVLSANAAKLLDLAQNHPRENVTFNFPDDDISLYDFIKVADRLLTGNSSAAIEFAAHGIPVIVHNENNNTNIPIEITHTAHSLSDYFNLLSSSTLSKDNLTHMRFAHRWIYFRNFRIGSPMSFRNQKIWRKLISVGITLGLKMNSAQPIVLAFFRLANTFVFPKYKGKILLDQDIPTFAIESRLSRSEDLEDQFLFDFLQHGSVFRQT